jgi:hypothetical protein
MYANLIPQHHNQNQQKEGFPIPAKLRKTLRQTHNYKGLESSVNKVLVRNEYTFVTRNAREIATEKAQRLTVIINSVMIT